MLLSCAAIRRAIEGMAERATCNDLCWVLFALHVWSLVVPMGAAIVILKPVAAAVYLALGGALS